jgi:ParB family chromosome partitioning protein
MRGGLGRGLGSLIPQKKNGPAPAPQTGALPVALPEDEPIARVVSASVRDIVPNPHQPRKEFHAEELEELASSIKKYGILQPLVVTEKPNGMFELISGERRLRAAKAAGLERVPAIVRTAEEQEKLELALIENIQREDLTPIEEAWSYARLIDEFGLTQEEVAKRVGKSRPVVANTLRLLKLPDDMQKALSDGEISMSMARVLAGMENPKEQRAMFDRMRKGEFTVREAEQESRKRKSGGRKPKRRDVNLLALEEELRKGTGGARSSSISTRGRS